MIIWSTDRQGYRSHGSWGSQYDVYALFLDSEAWDEFKRNKEESALAKEMTKNAKKQKEEKTTGKKDKLPELKIDFNNLEDRIARLTINSSNLGDAILTNDANKLFYMSRFEGRLRPMGQRSQRGKHPYLIQVNSRYASLEMDKEGKNIYMLSADASAKSTSIPEK